MSSRKVTGPEGRLSLLLLGLLHFSIVSHLNGRIGATRPRYPLNARDMDDLVLRPLREHDHSMRDLLQVDETRSEQLGKHKLVSKTADGQVKDLKDVDHDEFQVVESKVVVSLPDKDSNGGGLIHDQEAGHEHSKAGKAEEQQQQSDSEGPKVDESIEQEKLGSKETNVEEPELKTEEQQQKEEEKVDEPNLMTKKRKQEKEVQQPEFKSGELKQEVESEKKVEEPQLKPEKLQQDVETEETVAEPEIKNSKEGNSEEKEVEQPEFQNGDRTKQNIDQEPALTLKTKEQARKELAENKVDEYEIKAEVLEKQPKSELEKVEEPQQEGMKVDHEELELKTEEQQQESVEKKVEPESKIEQQQRGEEQITDDGKSQRRTETDQKEEEPSFIFPEPYLLGPTIKDWDEQRGAWLEANPDMKAMPDGKPRVLIVTGSQPEPCSSPAGDNFHVKSFKLKIDYARMHNYELYYNFVWLDPLFGSYWVKLPTLRKLMLTHPEIEWFLWMDSDALFTDMLFEPPFHTYVDFNMIMWGWENGVYNEKSWVGFNAGVFLIRNCQWSLDLIDKWSPMGPKGPVRDAYGKVLTAVLPDRGECPADDQSALGYLMITDEAVKSKVKLVLHTDYQISGWWIPVVETLETCMEKYHPGLGDERWPWITHFTGCGPCQGDYTTDFYRNCAVNIDRVFNFADNQVLAYMGYKHESLSSQAVIRTRNESSLPLEFVGVNPWADRIAQVAAEATAAKMSP